MAFITSRNPMAGREIELNVYDENGDVKTIKFVAQYKRQKSKAYKALCKKFALIGKPALDEDGQPTGETQKAPYDTDTLFLQDVMGGWVGLQHDDGSERVFSATELELFLEDWPEALIPLANGFHEVHNTAPAPRAKN